MLKRSTTIVLLLLFAGATNGVPALLDLCCGDEPHSACSMEVPVDACCGDEGAKPECETELTFNTLDDDLQQVDVPSPLQPSWTPIATVPVEQQIVTHPVCHPETPEQAVRPPDRSRLCTYII